MAEQSAALSTSGWPQRLLSIADWEGLPDELSRSELSEGVLVVVPPPHPRHQNAVWVLESALRRDLPTSLRALHECGVALGGTPPTARVPDVLVVSEQAYASGVRTFASADVVLAVEVISPGSRRTDTVTKADEYAQAGIEHYWVVDLDERMLTERLLGRSGRYDLVGEHRSPTTVSVAGAPVLVEVDRLW